ncbi:DNA cytosine methyltransferase [Candidatus Gracilibacteria bacterium]|nr:DNA cytosine methyltransferase [Candidatus Gracilibacteria bacterium]MCF7898778.1 DNA cytosine methyltransferase [Candidatus Paceibacterota bacterium]
MKKLSKNKKLKVVSLFSGCGGLDLGFINQGFEVIWSNDFFPDAVETYKYNIGHHINGKDITKVKSSEIPDSFDVLLGGFPCQGFSIANIKRSMEDERNFLYREMLRIVKDKRPAFFLAENVKGLLSMHQGEIIKMIVKDFEELGYKVDYKLLNSADYGVPQQRERVAILGNRLGVPNIFPKPTHGPKLKPYVTVQKATGHLADAWISYNPQKIKGKTVHNHIARTNVQDTFWGRKNEVNQHDVCDYLKMWRNKKGISTKKVDEHFGYKHTAGHWFRKDNNSGSIPNPDDWWKLKKLLGFDNKFDKKVTELELKEIKFEQSLRINNWDRPSDTITATGPEIHPNKKRRMSVRECAIIQTFPEDFVFSGSLGNMYKQIGNAVPVLMAEQIAKSIKKSTLDYYETIPKTNRGNRK